MSELQKKLKQNDIALKAIKIDNGIAIGSKKTEGYNVNAVVVLQENKDGTISLVINQDVLKEIGGNIVMKDFADPIPE